MTPEVKIAPLVSQSTVHAVFQQAHPDSSVFCQALVK
jgi:hypothetical protein